MPVPAPLPPRPLLYVCEATSGGILEYALCQAPALAAGGAEVTFLCRQDFPVNRLGVSTASPRPAAGSAGGGSVRVVPSLPPGQSGRSASRWQRALARLYNARRIAAETASQARSLSPAPVLHACYYEYFAPFWAGTLRRCAGQGTVFGTLAHDPVRNYRVGPRWWHERSVAAGYSFVRDVFVHDDTPVDTGGPQPRLRFHVIPHGPLGAVAPARTREDIRRELGFEPDDCVFFAFGHIRDNKNLDLFLRALPDLPGGVKLLVAGNENAASQRPAVYYQELARSLGVAERCRWLIRYTTPVEAAELFGAADVCLLTYARSFRSASSVLNTATQYRRPCLASDGGGPLTKTVARYRLGLGIAPDDTPAMVKGVRQLLAQPVEPEWARYEAENSWSRNAGLILQALSSP